MTSTGTYEGDKMLLMSELFVELVVQMDNNGTSLRDILGEFFQQHITEGKIGQYFTPETATDFIAQILSGSNSHTTQDPACRSGRMFTPVQFWTQQLV